MNTQCIVYVSDENYFFPTAVSALQARSNTKSSTDVLIVISEALQNEYNARKFCDDNDIVLIDASKILREKFAALDLSDFSHRITVSAMGCLLLSDVLPVQYTQAIYIDGDTQVNGSLSYLENLKVEPGKIIAALDYLSIVEKLNGNDQTVIFNSGVFKFDPRAWIGKVAFDHFVSNGGELHDQGALNAVVGDGLILISNHWNFPKQFLHLVGKHTPTIVHFMAHPKPWDGCFFPWTRKETLVYRQVLASNPLLKPFVKKISAIRYCVYKLRSFRDEWNVRWRMYDIQRNSEDLRKILS